MKEEIQKNITDALQGISPETSETIDSSSTDKIEKLLAALKDPQQALNNMF